jgi:putative transcriptional regulator
MPSSSQRSRLFKGQAKPRDIVALRAFVRLTQQDFAKALGISVYTLRGRRKPEGPAMALLRIAARHPRIIRENVATAA